MRGALQGKSTRAYEVLSDPDKRAKYDQFGHAAFDPSAGGRRRAGFGGFGGFKGTFSAAVSVTSSATSSAAASAADSSSAAARARGENLRVRLNITFEEAAFGCEGNQRRPCRGSVRTARVPAAPRHHAGGLPDCKGTGSVHTTSAPRSAWCRPAARAKVRRPRRDHPPAVSALRRLAAPCAKSDHQGQRSRPASTTARR